MIPGGYNRVMPLADISGRPIYYELHDPVDPDPTLPPLVLVMSMGGRCAGWIPLQVPAFRAKRQVLIYDHQGVGQSQEREQPYSTDDLGHDLLGLLDVLEIQQVDALGFFLGGMAVQKAALASPDRFRKLALVGSWARPDARRRLLLTEWAALARANTPAASMTRQRLIWTFSEEALEQADVIEPAMAHLDDGQTPLTGERFARQCDACLSHDTLAQLPVLEHSTLVLCGRRDLLTPPKFSREISEAMPNARDVALSYSGHAVMAERPRRFNEIVEHFLDETEYG
jgi:3-oxoadipate enol-lactonase